MVDTATVLTGYALELSRGDRLVIAGDTNRTRRYVRNVLNASSVEIGSYIRPSRGYARHLRRQKQARQ